MTGPLGAFGEAWAAAFLTRRGYVVLERNVRFRTGELDIVARDGADLVFVEVKCRRSSRFGSPEESIDARRFARLERAIGEYLASRDLDPPSYRVDVVALEVGRDGRVRRYNVLQGVGMP